jgi:antitoxin (DNA-binding transcriptional repressor) of toxin-antitoxin stability system
MSNVDLEPTTSYTHALVCIADYLSRPRQFVAVAEAGATLRQTLDRAQEASVVLTTNGEPAAAIVPFTTLEAMRGVLLQLLAQEMETNFVRLQAQVSSEPRGESTSETELEALVSDAVQRSRETSDSDLIQN